MEPVQKKGSFIEEALQELRDILAVVRNDEIPNAMGYLLSKKIREAYKKGFTAGIRWKTERSSKNQERTPAFGRR